MIPLGVVACHPQALIGKSTTRDLESGEIISWLASIPVDLRPKNIDQVDFNADYRLVWRSSGPFHVHVIVSRS